MSTSSLSSSASGSSSCHGCNGAAFRATDVWKKTIKDFRKGIPLKKKRYKMKYYEHSFSGADAVEWLHKYLQTSGNFGNVSRSQAIKLLEKFLECKVIAEVRDKEGVKFEDDGHLYHFVTTPNAFNCLDEEDEFEEDSMHDLTLRDPTNHFYTNSYAVMQFGRCADTTMDTTSMGFRDSMMEMGDEEPQQQLSSEELASVWKQFVLTRLLRVVDLPTLDGVLNHETVDGKHILRNIGPLSHLLRLARSVSGSSAHEMSEGEEKLPSWVSMAQKYLMKWPEYNDEFHCELPVYRGFEVDVLRAVWEYYSSSKESLVCSNLYELFLAVQSIVRSGKTDTAINALQLCMLLLPRVNKIKLQKLLRFMSKVASNRQLLLTDLMNNRQVMLDRFTTIILAHKKASPSECKELVSFMMDHYHDIFKIPDDLRAKVEEFISKRDADLEEATFVSSCRKVTTAEYEKQKDETSIALAGLLEDIIANTTLSAKVKKSKLKTFQKQYPDIYAARFR